MAFTGFNKLTLISLLLCFTASPLQAQNNAYTTRASDPLSTHINSPDNPPSRTVSGNKAAKQSPALGKVSGTLEIRTIDILPYGIKRAEKTEGLYFDLANLVAAEAGYPAHNYVVPYARIMFELKSGQTDMSILFKYPELEDHVVYIAPLTPLKTVVIGLKGSDIHSVASLQGKTLGYLRGAKFSDAIDQNKHIQKVETTDFLQAVKLLMFKRVDAIIGPIDPILSAAIELGQDSRLFGRPLTVAERTPWIQISKKSLGRVSAERLTAAFNSLDSQNTIQQLRQHYIAPLPVNSPSAQPK